MKKKYIFILISSLTVITLFVYQVFFEKNNLQDKAVESNVGALKSDIISETASSTDSIILEQISKSEIIIPNTANSKVTIGNILLTKPFLDNTDIIGFGSLVSGNNKKVLYLLVWRKNNTEYKLISSSKIEQAQEIVTLRSVDATNQNEYYVDIQFTPIGKDNETEGAIKIIGIDGIR
jgi:hypothetical protein